MLKKLMLLLVVCGFMPAAHASAVNEAAKALVSITAVTGGVVFAGGFFATAIHHCRALVEKDQSAADGLRRDRDQNLQVAVVGAVVCMAAAFALDGIGYNPHGY